jgi:hypothetical protein
VCNRQSNKKGCEEMTKNQEYKITKRIKLHTSPLREIEISQQGRFVRETATNYIFDKFWTRKKNVIEIQAVTK